MTGHAAVEAAVRLHAVAVDLFAGEPVNVGFGPRPGPVEALDTVAIAYSEPDIPMITGTVDYQGIQAQRDQIEVSCLVSSLTGDEDDGPARLARCFELMTRLAQQVLAVQNPAPTSGLVQVVPTAAGAHRITWSGISRYQTQWIRDSKLTGAQVLFPLAVAAHGSAITG
ncbi:hypothetical protein [Pseudonocardia sp. TMWB2A]|uniref:hypothetical protein n=1 Tax=Pseudonocardia sp. TMWB2A TaxID=687430 RepID=UPI00307DB05E